MVAGRRMQAELFQQNQQSKPVAREETILQTFLNNDVEYIGYQHFMAVSENVGRKVPVVNDVLSSHEQETHPSTSLDENCIEFLFQTE